MAKADTQLLGRTLVFKLKTKTTFSNFDTVASLETSGTVELEHTTSGDPPVALVNYAALSSRGNPVLEYLHRAGSEVEQIVYLERPIPICDSKNSPLTITAPGSNIRYAKVSGDYNPVHTSRVFAEYANLPGTITHGMYTSGAIRSLIEYWVNSNNAGAMRIFDVRFVGMVLPGDEIEVRLNHVGMISGLKVIQIEAIKISTGEKVMLGETTVKQPVSAYVFTGQGSQDQGMGMDLYSKSAVAKEIWDRADKHLLDTYGFSIIDIVKYNPKELTVHFGGARGQAIKKTYMAMTQGTERSSKTEKLFKEITVETTSYTYRSPNGLLSATQFTQPALTVMQMAAFADSRARGVIQSDSVFAGHSLGEYSALACSAEVMPIETLAQCFL